MRSRLLTILLVLVAAATLPATASASQLIDRNTKGARLAVNRKNVALVTYRAHGMVRHVLAWGAINARPPSRSYRQVEFKIDYSGGWGSRGKVIWRRFKNVCGPYAGPELHWVVAACTMPDGSHWALQSWYRLLPRWGMRPKNYYQAARDLRLSHWTGEPAVLDIKQDWVYKRWDHLYGRLTYNGKPVYGYRATSTGAVLDSFGRNIFIDTYNSAYGRGWKRENGFLAHRPTGAFCYGLYPHGRHDGAGKGEAYRATVAGPGVSPDAFWSAPALGAFDPDIDAAANAEQNELFARDRFCKAR